MENYEEEEVMPGVFLYKNKDLQPSTRELIKEYENSLSKDDITADIMKLINSVQHLEKSNIELEEAISIEYDKDFEDAIKENIIIIDKKKQQIIELNQTLFQEFKITIPIPEDILDCSSGLFV